MASKRALPDDFSTHHPSKRPGTIDSYRPSHDRRPSDSSRTSSGNHTPVNEKPPQSKRVAEPIDTKLLGNAGDILGELLRVTSALSIASLRVDTAEKEVDRCRADYQNAEKSFANYPAFGELKLVALRREEAVLEQCSIEVRRLEAQRESFAKQYADALSRRTLPREDELVDKLTRAVEARLLSRMESKDAEIEYLKAQIGRQSDSIAGLKSQCGDLRQEFGISRTEVKGLRDDDALLSRKVEDVEASYREVKEKVESRDSMFVTKEELEETQVNFAVDQAKIWEGLKRSEEEKPRIAQLLANFQNDTARLVDESQVVKALIDGLDKSGDQHEKAILRIEQRQQTHEKAINDLGTDLGEAANPDEGSFEWRLQQVESKLESPRENSNLAEGRSNIDRSSVGKIIDTKQDELRNQFDETIQNLSENFTRMMRTVSEKSATTQDICTSLETSVFKEIAKLKQTVEENSSRDLERIQRSPTNAKQDTEYRLKALEAESISLARRVTMHVQQQPSDSLVNTHKEVYQMKMEQESLRQTCRNLEDRYMNTTSEHVVKAMCDEFNTNFGFDKYVNQFNIEVGKVQREYALILKDPQGMPARVQTLEKTVHAISSAVDQLREATPTINPRTIAEISTNIERVEAALAEHRNAIEEAIAKTQEQRSLDQSTHRDLDSRVTTQSTHAAGYQATIAALKADLKNLRERVDLGETKSGDLETQYEKLKDQLDRTVINWNLPFEEQKRAVATLVKDFAAVRDTTSKLEATAKAREAFDAEVKIKAEKVDDLERQVKAFQSGQSAATPSAPTAEAMNRPKKAQKQATPGNSTNGTGRSTPTSAIAPPASRTSPSTKKFLSKPTEQPRGRGRPPKQKAAGPDSSEGEGKTRNNPLWIDGADER